MICFIQNFDKHLIQNLILYGSHGTGKTLLLNVIFRMKVAYYHLQGKTVKVTIATYNSSTPLLREDFDKKLKLSGFLERFNIEFQPKTFAELSTGTINCQIGTW